MVMKLLRAFDAGFTAFVNELSPYPFPLLGDYVADALEDDGLCDDCSLSWPTEVSSAGRVSANAGVEENPEAVLPRPASGHPDPCLIAAAANGLRMWIDSGGCEHPTYWGWIARELCT